MKNGEKFEKEIWNKACNGLRISVIDGSPEACFESECTKCELKTTCIIKGYRKAIHEWCESEYIERKITIPENAKVDTKVLVSRDGKVWSRRYLKEVKDNRVIAFEFGRTSWSSDSNYDVMSWEYGKLAEESDGT